MAITKASQRQQVEDALGYVGLAINAVGPLVNWHDGKAQPTEIEGMLMSVAGKLEARRNELATEVENNG